MSYRYHLDGKRVFVSGHRGMVGSALCKALRRRSNIDVLTAERRQCDLTQQSEVDHWMRAHKPDAIIDAAAKVGGIVANDRFPGDFLYNNMMIQANITHSAFKHGVERLLLLGSSCIYPKMASQPIQENSMLSGPLEPTNQWYAIAKIAGLKLCAAYRRQYSVNYISAMPTNLYGENDNFDALGSHVVPGLMRKMHDAKIADAGAVEIWGTGRALREFMHVDDLADACVFLMEHYDDEQHINIGIGEEISIGTLAETMRDITGFQGSLTYNTDYPDGTPRNLLDSGKMLSLGWRPSISLSDGLGQTYRWFQDQIELGAVRGYERRSPPSRQAINNSALSEALQ